ncbi:type II toxin-antitoxin system HicA family toxin [Candidatus Magnetaquicoccus inordinatus]|uniref:type II toxin-antitoxin system HicA family toxin n=1 Tax=Candidatus Magnetaquicoccus inordinatus TaxID=2496818 RepID=UPI001D0E0753|nr:type II toxin-antitoxin system HicA family toxin [Candidatus Magnetaquicoccus inordinatus]
MGKSMSSREVIEILTKAGWQLDSIRGDHHHFKHLDVAGKVTVPHPLKDVPLVIVKLIEKQAGIKIS